eukprot:356013-Chlamydomonas_euryale.AAC.5
MSTRARRVSHKHGKKTVACTWACATREHVHGRARRGNMCTRVRGAGTCAWACAAREHVHGHARRGNMCMGVRGAARVTRCGYMYM